MASSRPKSGRRNTDLCVSPAPVFLGFGVRRNDEKCPSSPLQRRQRGLRPGEAVLLDAFGAGDVAAALLDLAGQHGDGLLPVAARFQLDVGALLQRFVRSGERGWVTKGVRS